MASTYLTRTVSSASNRRTWTWSAWVKLGALSGNQSFFTSRSDNANYSTIRIEPDRFHIFDLVSSGFNYQVKTNRRLRDPNAWYNLVVAFDTTQATASNRIKLYVNGEQETSLAESSYPAQNYEGFINRNRDHYIGQGGNQGDRFDGSMSHINFVDGTALTPSSFGSTDSTTGEWEINTSPNVTYGTNGFFILKDDNAVTDRSGQGNNFTLGAGTLTKTEDSPSSVFNTFNANFQEGGGVLSNGNTTYYNASTSNWYTAASNLAASVGKYYCELKITDATNNMVGVGDMQYLVARGQNSLTHIGALNPGGVGLYNDNGEKYLQGSNTTYAASYGDGDILSIALDMDNDKVYFAKNGDWSTGSGAWGSSTFDAAVGAITLPTTNATYGFASSQRNGAKAEWNFGNGYFGTTAVSSAGTNASGNGIFEYNVPANFTALSTKGLNL